MLRRADEASGPDPWLRRPPRLRRRRLPEEEREVCGQSSEERRPLLVGGKADTVEQLGRQRRRRRRLVHLFRRSDGPVVAQVRGARHHQHASPPEDHLLGFPGLSLSLSLVVELIGACNFCMLEP